MAYHREPMRVNLAGALSAASPEAAFGLPPPGLEAGPVSLPLPRWAPSMEEAAGGAAVPEATWQCLQASLWDMPHSGVACPGAGSGLHGEASASHSLAAVPECGALALGPWGHAGGMPLGLAQEHGWPSTCPDGARKDGSRARWWTKAEVPLLCPITEFPVEMLPYPPFRLRVDPRRSTPHRLVDGKSLALQLIVSGRFHACGRDLDYSDIEALDDHICRCKLGSYRPGKALALAREAVSVDCTPAQRAEACVALERLTMGAWGELEKLRRIQQSRLAQLPHRAAGPRCRAPPAEYLESPKPSRARRPQAAPRCPPQWSAGAAMGASVESTTTIGSDSESSGSLADLL